MVNKGAILEIMLSNLNSNALTNCMSPSKLKLPKGANYIEGTNNLEKNENSKMKFRVILDRQSEYSPNNISFYKYFLITI